ncbi:zf-HC2 domain-containing protein [Umezawaea sp. Da 62-37]|uniref:anti-sigma factor family protein n=1 Tax=Umezawaea sp. Da 62-37 TaxID=3075927 RepID=UPI0028F74589|nr:zf-HC2 domain-containing protein [Umezawaea sp. Da 62-37]WNV89927.1 zf-HC2 domain-containing protein [Umezawaea sp. Da 62-37]
MSCFQITSLGAYLLGALDPAERSVFERHLNTCHVCREELIRLAPLPGLLGQVNLADLELPFDDPDPYDNQPLPPITALRSAPEPRPRKSRRTLLLVGAGVLVVLLAVVGLFLPRLVGGDPVKVAAPSSTAPPPPTWSAMDGKTGVAASVAMVSHGWGTEVRLRLKDVKPGLRCMVVLYAKSGTREVGGWWGTSETENEVIPGSSSFAVDGIDHMEVVADQQVLVTLRPPG